MDTRQTTEVDREQAVKVGKSYRQGIDRPPPGSQIVMRDGTNYLIAPDGSFRHLHGDKKLTKAQKKQLKKQRRKWREQHTGVDQPGGVGVAKFPG